MLLSLENVKTSNIVSESMLAYPHSGQPVSRHWYACISKTKKIVKKISVQIDNGVIEALMVEGRLGGVRSIESTLKCERL